MKKTRRKKKRCLGKILTLVPLACQPWVLLLQAQRLGDVMTVILCHVKVYIIVPCLISLISLCIGADSSTYGHSSVYSLIIDSFHMIG